MFDIDQDDLHSKEELYFSWWLKELYDENIILKCSSDVFSIELNKAFTREYIKPMKRVEDKILLQEILPAKVYTPDFEIEWNLKHPYIKKFIGDWCNFNIKYKPIILSKKGKSVVETKGTWDQNNMTRLFKQNQSWIWDKHSIFINLVKLPNLFYNSFTPNRYLYTDKSTTRLRKQNNPDKIKTLKEFLIT